MTSPYQSSAPGERPGVQPVPALLTPEDQTYAPAAESFPAATTPAQPAEPAQPAQQAEPAQPEPAPGRPAAGFDDRGRVRRGRAGALWITLIAGAIGLILLIIFIAQNSSTVLIKFLGWSGHLSVGLTVLIAAVVGLLLAAIPGTTRILQLRRALKKNTPKDQRTR